MAEATWAAEHGFVGLCLGNCPVYGPKQWGNLEYNDPAFEPFWSLIEEAGLPLTFHVSTGRDPRAVGGNGGAIINYVCHSHGDDDRAARAAHHVGRVRAPPDAAGRPRRVRHRLRAVAARDDGLRLQGAPLLGPPGDPRAAVDVLPRATASPRSRRTTSASTPPSSYDLVDNLMWANDYPHHEGSWPHSAASIERQMGGLAEESRAKILGLNAKRVFAL